MFGIIKSRCCFLLRTILLLSSIPTTGASHSQYSQLSYFDTHPVEEQQRENRLHRDLDELNRPETSPTEVRHSGHSLNGSGNDIGSDNSSGSDSHGIFMPATEDTGSTREGSAMVAASDLLVPDEPAEDVPDDVSLIDARQFYSVDQIQFIKEFCSAGQSPGTGRMVVIRPEHNLGKTLDYYIDIINNDPVLLVLDGNRFELDRPIYFRSSQQLTLCGLNSDISGSTVKPTPVSLEKPVIKIRNFEKCDWCNALSLLGIRLELRNLWLDATEWQTIMSRQALIFGWNSIIVLDQVGMEKGPDHCQVKPGRQNYRRCAFPRMLDISGDKSHTTIIDSEFIVRTPIDWCDVQGYEAAIYGRLTNTFIMRRSLILLENGASGITFYGDVPHQYISLEQNTFIATNAPAIALNFRVTQNILLRNNLFLGQLVTGVSFLNSGVTSYNDNPFRIFEDISHFTFRNRIETGSGGNRWEASGNPCSSFPGKGAVIWQNAAPCQSLIPETGPLWDVSFQDASRNNCPYITSATTSPPDLTTASPESTDTEILTTASPESTHTEIFTTESSEPVLSVISDDHTGSSSARTVTSYQTLLVLAVIFSTHVMHPFID